VDVQALGPEIIAFLEAPRLAVIATHDPDGEIWQAVVWFVLTDDGILLNSLEGRRWLNNIRRDPRVSLAVAEGEESVILRGDAVVVEDPERGVEDAFALARRYGGGPAVDAGQRRISVVLYPRRVGVHGELRLEGS
jgi:PPOX class probable F420-dependent enzyme